MSFLQMVIAVLITPVSAILIALVIYPNARKITAQAHMRAERERRDATE